MPSYKKGYWVRIHFEAPSLEDADKVSLSARAIEQHAAFGPETAQNVEVEVEWEHTSIFDAEGREIERWTQEGQQEPDSTSDKFGNFYR
jgi:hypothetical protein